MLLLLLVVLVLVSWLLVPLVHSGRQTGSNRFAGDPQITTIILESPFKLVECRDVSSSSSRVYMNKRATLAQLWLQLAAGANLFGATMTSSDALTAALQHSLSLSQSARIQCHFARSLSSMTVLVVVVVVVLVPIFDWARNKGNEEDGAPRSLGRRRRRRRKGNFREAHSSDELPHSYRRRHQQACRPTS